MFHAKKQLITTHGAAGEFENVLFSEKKPVITLRHTFPVIRGSSPCRK